MGKTIVPGHHKLRRSAGWYGARAALLALLAAALLADVMGGSAGARGGVGRPQAIRSALRALDVTHHGGAEIVFGLAAPIRKHTTVSVAGPGRPASGGRAVVSGAGVIARPRHAAWVFYDDRAPFEAYEHPGRVALVDAITGRVTVSRPLRWPPAIGGALPPFLRSATAYASPRARVFYRAYHGAAELAPAASDGHATGGARAALDPTQTRRVGALLAAEHACVVEVGDSLSGGYYSFARVSQSLGALSSRFAQIRRQAAGVRALTYSRNSRETPVALVRDEISRHGCRNVLVYLAGSGYQGAAAVNIGMQLGHGRVRHQDVTLSNLRALINAEPKTTFAVIVDAPFASGFGQLARIRNVRLIATPVAPGQRSFTYLPEAVVGGVLRANDTDPLRLLQLTDRVAAGMDAVIDNRCDTATAATLQRRGSPALAYLAARAAAAGGSVDWVARAGLGSAPAIRTAGFSAGTPRCLPGDAVNAMDDAYTVQNNAFFGTPVGHGVLSNDSDTQQHPISIDQLNGNGGALPLHGASANGAAVTLHGDGLFSYDASAVASLQALPRGRTTTDSFTYRATDDFGATATATVRLTVVGTRNHAPSAQADAAAMSISAPPITGADVRANDTDPDSDPLTIDQLNGHEGTPPLHATTEKGAAVTLNANGTYTYDPSGSTNLEALPHGATANDSFTYRVNDGHGGTSTGMVTITVGGTNHAPLAKPDSYATNADQSLSVPASGVLANDIDADNDPLKVAELNGSTTLSGTSTDGAAVTVDANGSFTYDPSGSATLKALAVGVQRTDTFTYTADDGNLGTSTATVSITVTGVNDPPVANADSYATNANQTLSPNAASGVLANDTDADNDTLTVTKLNGVSTLTGTSADGAVVTVQSDGSFTYDPSGSATLKALGVGVQTTDTFSYTADDGHGGATPATVSITVTGVNDAPTATDDGSVATPAASTNSDTPLANQSSLLANDSDPDTGDTLSLNTADTTSAKGATVSVGSDGKWSYDPTSSSTLQGLPKATSTTDTFTYSVKDNHGGTSNTATVTVKVTGVNHAPVANPDNYTVAAGQTLNDGSSVLGNDADADSDSLTATLVSGPSHASAFTLNTDGTFSYTNDGTTGSDTFTYKANDGTTDSAVVTVTIDVTP